MTSHPLADCCLTIAGVKHNGTPVGEIKQIGDIDTYFVYPADKSTKHAIIFLTDVYGIALTEARLIADQLASNGYFVVIPDLFNHDAISVVRPADFDLQKWLAGPPGHGPDVADPIVRAVITELRDNLGVKRIGAVGYCYGARYVVRQLKDGLIDVGYIAHPSLVQAEELEAITGPLSIAAPEIDTRFPIEKRVESENILKKVGQPWQINTYSGCEHGFAVRGDISRRLVKFAKEQAFLQAVHWFGEFLKED